MKAVENMQGKRALVTGAGTGIGSGLALAITARGHSLDACNAADASPGTINESEPPFPGLPCRAGNHPSLFLNPAFLLLHENIPTILQD
jgi:NAD(P)-dependent dehydrogenase (short-subunit alcohol dehydrogenase family)